MNPTNADSEALDDGDDGGPAAEQPRPSPAGDRSVSPTLEAALRKYDLSFDEPLRDRLRAFAQALWTENRAINLTRHLDFDLFVARDIHDALQLAALLAEGEKVLDIGSGGGVPGVLLALLRPDLEVHLCDSVAKKVAALRRIVAACGAPCPVLHDRAESILENRRFDACVARAVGPLRKIIVWFQGRWPHLGRLLALKGIRWQAELDEARAVPAFREVHVRLARTYPLLGTTSSAYVLELRGRSTR